MHALTRKALPALLLAVAVALAAGCARNDTGVLEGQVTIGPMVPALPEGQPQPTPRPEDYAAREVVVLNGNGIGEVARVSIDASGHYRIMLLPGLYQIDINHAGTDRAESFPRSVTIVAGETTTLDIDIDTGIR